jgi:hypothetical protein
MAGGRLPQCCASLPHVPSFISDTMADADAGDAADGDVTEPLTSSA